MSATLIAHLAVGRHGDGIHRAAAEAGSAFQNDDMGLGAVGLHLPIIRRRPGGPGRARGHAKQPSQQQGSNHYFTLTRLIRLFTPSESTSSTSALLVESRTSPPRASDRISRVAGSRTMIIGVVRAFQRSRTSPPLTRCTSTESA